MILILGGSGFIGRNLLSRFKKDGLSAVGTYFKNKISGLEYFDIASMRPEGCSLFFRGLNYIIISAASDANIDGTKKNWDIAYYVNVTKIKEIIGFCFQNNIVPVYISTDNVFDGGKGNYKETDQANPINCYGKIKHDVEEYLLASGFKFIILRVGKVFSISLEDGTLITSMIRDLKDSKTILCADDQLFSPVFISDLTDAVKMLLERKINGIFHLSSIRATTRYAIAKTAADYFRIQGANILSCKINSLGLVEKRPLLIDLDCSKFGDLTGFKQRDITYYLDLIPKNNFSRKSCEEITLS